MLNDKEYKDRFEKLYQFLTRAHLYFFVWKGLQKTEYQTQFNKDKNFWGAVIPSLEQSWLQALANIYEDSTYSEQDKVISVYSLIKNQKDQGRKTQAKAIIKNNEAVIKNIFILRSHQLSHYNAKHFLDPEVVSKKFPVKYGDIEKLLGITEELLHCLHPESTHNFSFEGFDEGAEKSPAQVMKRIGYYIKQEEKHYNKLKDGDKYIKFPPEE